MHACGNLPSTILQATILYTPSSTRNASGDRAPEMHETRRGKQGYFEMKAHTGVDAKEGHGHSMATSSRGLPHAARVAACEERKVWSDSGHQGQTEAMNEVTPTTQDVTCTRTGFKDYVDQRRVDGPR
jgi:IS5 family transposase